MYLLARLKQTPQVQLKDTTTSKSNNLSEQLIVAAVALEGSSSNSYLSPKYLCSAALIDFFSDLKEGGKLEVKNSAHYFHLHSKCEQKIPSWQKRDSKRLSLRSALIRYKGHR